MKYEFERDFAKDFYKLNDKRLAQAILHTIQNVASATSLDTIRNIKKLKGHKTAYRIRSGDYRIGVFIEDDTVFFSAFDHRSKIYKRFPKK
jgi:mRNA interferase RelE/StbE